MIDRSGVEGSLPSTRAQALDRLPQSIRDIAEEALAYLEPRLGQVLQIANEELFQMSDACETMEQRRGLFEAAQVLHVQREATIKCFALEFLAGFDPPPRQPRGEMRGRAPTGTLAGVEVLNGDAFDLSVAVSTVTSRSASKHKDYIDRLAPALADTRGSDYSSQRNPLSVFRVTGAFMTAIGRLGLDTSVKRLLLDLFERDVIDGLGGMYRQVCEVLRLDDYGDAPASLAGGAEPEAESARATTAERGEPASGTEFAVLRGLMQGQRNTPPVGDGARGRRAATGPAVSAAQVVEALGVLGMDPELVDPGRGLDLRAVVGRALAEQGTGFGEVEEVAQDILQLVSMLFEHMLRDENLSIPVGSLIARLQIPVLKIALVDSSVFDDADHAVRRVINRLADAGIGWWGDTDEVRREPLFLAIDRVVSRIVDECHIDADIFIQADNEISSIVGKSAIRAKNLEQRLNERESGKVKVNAARSVAQDLINSRASGLRLPEGLAGFIRDEWTKVMIYLCIRHGVDSSLWREALQAFEELLIWGQPAAKQDDLARRAERLPFLLERIEHWLHRAGFPSAQAESRLQGLYDAFRELSEHDKTWFESSSHYEVHELNEMDVIELVAPDAFEAVELDSKLEALLAPIQPGTWVEFLSDGQAVCRCKLSMVFEQSRNHLFVDHRGLRVCEMSALEVAESLRDGHLRELQADPVVERALDEMISALRDSMRG